MCNLFFVFQLDTEIGDFEVRRRSVAEEATDVALVSLHADLNRGEETELGDSTVDKI